MASKGKGLSPVNQYKNWEDQVARQVKRGFSGFFSRVAEALGRLWTLGRQNFTIMLIPHSERKIINFKISVFALTFLGLLGVGVMGALYFYTTNFVSMARQSDLKGSQLELAQTNLEMVREEVAQLRSVARQFEDSLNSTMTVVGISAPKAAEAAQVRGDLASLVGLQQVEQGAVREVGELKNLRNYLTTTGEPLAQISDVLSSQKSLLVDIPTLWPLKDVRGWVTTPFGPAIHPFTGQWYLHKGIDIAQRLGTPVVATANGKVSKVDYEALGYGHYVDLKHNYGFSTRYGHLSRSYVTKGQDVVRGQVIAALGASGLATGPHLHYEVRIGTQVVDPGKYLSFSSNLFDKESP